MRGGAERTRTACQARSRYRTGLSRVSSAATILRSNVAERQHYPERTGIRAPLERYCALISGAKGAPRSCPAGSIAEVGLRECGATPRNRTEDLKCQSLQRSDRWRQRQPPFQRQNHRDTVLAIRSRRGPIAARSNRASSPYCNPPRGNDRSDGGSRRCSGPAPSWAANGTGRCSRWQCLVMALPGTATPIQACPRLPS